MSSLKNIKISNPTYRDKLPSSGKDVTLSPFKVGDEKTLLIAAESKDNKQMVDAMKQIIGNNVEGATVDEMAPFDLEYLFLKLRSVSVGETSDIGMKCGPCGHTQTVGVDVTQAKVIMNPEHTNMIRLDETLGFKMKWPELDRMVASGDDLDGILKMIAESVEVVYHGEETIQIGAAEMDDMVDLIKQLTTKQFQKVQKFFEHAPRLTQEVEFKCEKCGEVNTTKLEGLASFF